MRLRSFALSLALLLGLAASTSAQAPGTVVLQGPLENSSKPAITPTYEAGQINTALQQKMDASGGTATNPTIAGTVNSTNSSLPMFSVDSSGNVHVTFGPGYGNQTVILAPAATAPAQPTISVTAGVSENTITWTDGANNGAPITEHYLYSSLVAGNEPTVETQGILITGPPPYVDTSVTPTVQTFYKLTAVNIAGQGAPSNEASGTPTAPSGGALVTLSTFPFNWGNQAAATETGGGGSPLVLSSPANHTQPVPVSNLVTPLSPGSASYTAKVTINTPSAFYYMAGLGLANPSGAIAVFGAQNNGTSDIFNVQQWTSPTTYVSSYGSIASGTASIRGTPVWMRVLYNQTANTYAFYLSVDGQANDWTLINTLTAAQLNNPTLIGPALFPLDFNSTGTAASVTWSSFDIASGVLSPQLIAAGVTPLTAAAPSAAPASPVATSGAGAITLSASAVSAYPAVSGYTIARGTTANGENKSTPLAVNVPLPYVDSSATPGTEYFYEIAAVNSSGTGPYSTEVNGTATAVTGAPGTAVNLSTDGSLIAATINGSTFSWNNQAGASLSGSGTTNAPYVLTDPLHANSINAKALMTKMATGATTYTMSMTNPNGNGGYTLGMFLYSSNTGQYTLLEDSGANDSASSLNVISETNLQGGSQNYLVDDRGKYDFFCVWTAQCTYRIDTDGTNVNFSGSLSGAAGSYKVIYTTTLAALGNPDHIGIYMNSGSTDSSYGTYPGYTKLMGFAATAGDTPQATGPGDPTGTFYTAAQYAHTNTLPQISGSVPYGSPAGSSSLTPVFDMVYGSGGVNTGETATPNVTSSAQFRTLIYTTYLEGNFYTAIGSPQDTGQGYGENSAFYSVARTYPVGDSNDLIPIESDGLHVKAICAQNHKSCTPMQIYAGYYRLPQTFRPGMVIEYDMISPVAYHSWGTSWLFTGQQLTPYPGTDPKPGVWSSNTGTGFEIDFNDNFPIYGCSQTVGGLVKYGAQLDFGTPFSYYGQSYGTAPHTSYSLNNSVWNNSYLWCQENYSPPSVRHYVIDWNGNYITILVDNVLVAQNYMEWNQQSTGGPTSAQTNGASNYSDLGSGPVGMVWNVGGEVVPIFQNDMTPSGGGCSFSSITNGCSHYPTNGVPFTENEGFGESGWGFIMLRQAAWMGHLTGLPSGG